MQNEESSTDLVQVDHDLHDFQQRAVEHDKQGRSFGADTARRTTQAFHAVPTHIRRLPRRYLLHMLILALLPVGFLVNRYAASPAQNTSPSAAAAAPVVASAQRPMLGVAATSNRNDPAPLAPATDGAPTEDPGVGDPPLADDSLIVPVSRPVEVQPTTLQATVSAEQANLRNGPSTEFDKLDKLAAGTSLEVIARHEDWVQVRTEGGQQGWLALELLSLSEEAVSNLPVAADVPAPPPAKVGLITENDLNLRDGPGTEYVSLMKLPVELEVSLIANYNGWYQIETPKGTVGWVSAEFLSLREGVAERIAQAESIPPANPAMVGYVTDEGVNLRGGPGTGYESLGKLANGVELQLLAKHDDWLKVETPKGTKGWISAELVDASGFVMRRVAYTDNIPALPKKAAPKAKAPSNRAAAPAAGGGGGGGVASGDVASLAWAYNGSRYVWGGEGPGGFDCSGLTRFLYRQVGVSLPHSAAGQYSSRYGSFIGSMNNLQPGDLLFYANTAGPGITHVGIYVGGGTMINAMTPRTGVGAVSIYSSYWLNHYYGALRPYR